MTIRCTHASPLTASQVVTDAGRVVRATDVVLAGSGHLPASVDADVARSVVPCVSYILVTEPLGARLATAIDAPPYAAFDDRFALNYFRPLPDGRLLWGGKSHVVAVWHSPHKRSWRVTAS